jgi:hypothetical protein
LISVSRYLLYLVLSDFLIEYLVIEFLWRSVNKTVVEFTTMRLHKIHLSWRGAVSKFILSALSMSINPLLIHYLFMWESSILHWDKTLSWRSMFSHIVVEKAWLTCVFFDVIIHYSIESIILATEVSILPIFKELTKQGIIFSLNCCSLLLKLLISIECLSVAWSWNRTSWLFVCGVGQLFGWLYLSWLWWRHWNSGKRNLHIYSTTANVIAIQDTWWWVFSDIFSHKLWLRDRKSVV